MPLQNRVQPDNQLVHAKWRGTMMGNRGGRIHDPISQTLTGRQWSSKRWIACVLRFKERHRLVMGNSYTELFFLDDAQALSCGHRPCFECRRGDANHFKKIWNQVHGEPNGSFADFADGVLHGERTVARRKILRQDYDSLPVGSFILQGRCFMARTPGGWRQWTGEGYAPCHTLEGEMELLTPPAILAMLAAGYAPRWHESAQT